MSDPFVAEIRIFPFNFPPKGWAWCNGQLLPLSQNTALFSLLGTTYGGDGKSNFALPNLQGSTPLFWGQGPGLSLYDIGQTGGSETVTLIQSELPSHGHTLNAQTAAGTTSTATNNTLAEGQWNNGQGQSGGLQYYTATAPNTSMGPFADAPAGSSLPHNNMMPYLTLYFCIALQGVYPPRT
ncbi:MAG TPA: tail fiber protein [Rhizomicrobium sp.]|nr:tail fiber protein [Rhizomicrobium sp.]